MRHTRPLLVPALILFACAQLEAQDAVLRGFVLDAERETAVAEADVRIPALGLRTRTSSFGEFSFTAVPSGQIILSVSHPGYQTRSDTLNLEDGETVEVRVPLGVEAFALAPLVVVGRRTAEATPVGAPIRGMTRAEIEEASARAGSIADLLRESRIPGLRVQDLSIPGQDPRTCVELARQRTSRFGQGSCFSVEIIIDGVRAPSNSSILTDLSPDMIERFEVLTATEATTLYGERGGFGALVIETRRGAAGRRLASYPRDEASWAIEGAVLGFAASEVYDGEALLSYAGEAASVRYTERVAFRPGARLAIRARPFDWLPELSLAGYVTRGSSTADLLATSVLRTAEHRFRAIGAELTIRPRLTRGRRWDLTFMVGPTVAREEVTVERAAVFPAAPGLGESLADRMGRSWTTFGVMVGADFEWVLNQRWGLLSGARWYGLTSGESGTTVDLQSSAVEDQFALPQADGRSGRLTLQLGVVLRPG